MTKHSRGRIRSIPTPDVSFGSAAGLPAVYVRDAWKSFGEKTVLKGFSLMINRGEVVSLIGPSGAGKSTILRCLTMLDRFDNGEFAYDAIRVCTPDESGEECVYDKEAMREARMRFGIVFQDYNLFPHYTVLKNVMDAPIVVQKREPAEVEEEARALLKKLDLEEHADKVPCELSGGQQQRVAIARALAMNPRVLYFDEATSALDPKLTDYMRQLIRELAADGMAVCVVTHEMGFARLVSDRVCILIDGEIAEQGTPEQVINNPKDPRVREFLAFAED